MIEIPGYTVLEEIGRGGFATVHKATQKYDDQPVAIKIPLQGFENKIRDEFNTYKKLGRHTHIIEVKGGDPDCQNPYLVLEAVENNLQDKLPELNQEQKLNVVKQTLEALIYAEEKDIVHKDIKPANVLLTSDNQAKLSDFGLAENKKELEVSYEKSSKIEGTFDHMAPEVLEGKPATHQSDIFSYGALIYEVFTGRKMRGAVKSTGNKILDEVILNCTGYEPQERYQSFKDVKKDLEKVMEGVMTSMAVEAKPFITNGFDSPKYEKNNRSHKSTVGIGSILGFAAITTVLGLLIYDYMHFAESRKEKNQKPAVVQESSGQESKGMIEERVPFTGEYKLGETSYFTIPGYDVGEGKYRDAGLVFSYNASIDLDSGEVVRKPDYRSDLVISGIYSCLIINDDKIRFESSNESGIYREKTDTRAIPKDAWEESGFNLKESHVPNLKKTIFYVRSTASKVWKVRFNRSNCYKDSARIKRRDLSFEAQEVIFD